MPFNKRFYMDLKSLIALPEVFYEISFLGFDVLI